MLCGYIFRQMPVTVNGAREKYSSRSSTQRRAAFFLLSPAKKIRMKYSGVLILDGEQEVSEHPT